MTVLETPRLRLTPVTEHDAGTLHRIWTDPDVRRYLWDDVVIDRDTASAVVAQTLQDWRERRYGLWLIAERATNGIAGFTGFRSSDDGPELLFGLLPACWHRGLATEAAEAALRYAFEHLGMSTVWAATDVPNTASVHVMERLGMTFDRREPDALVYHITRNNFFHRHRSPGVPSPPGGTSQ